MGNQRWRRLCAAGALWGITVLAQAQSPYIWIDEKGMKQLSDRPPAPSVPRHRILKEPTRASATQSGPQASTAQEPPTLAERDIDFLKRRAQAGAVQQKAEQEARHQREVAGNCELQRKNLQLLESNAPVGILGADGARAFLDDEARAKQAKEIRSFLTQCPP
jgi:hypothetical protein